MTALGYRIRKTPPPMSDGSASDSKRIADKYVPLELYI